MVGVVMKAIFLDIDGVLNKENWMLNGTPWLEEEKLDLISKLCKNTGANVVLSTNWREIWNEPMYVNDTNNGIHKAHKLFNKYDIQVVGTTPVFGAREDEISAALKNLEIDKFVVIDDTDLHIANFVQTNKKVGFCKADYEKALSILNT